MTCQAPFLRATISIVVDSGFEGLIAEKNAKFIEGAILHLDDQERQGFKGEIGSEPLISDLVQILKNVITLGLIKTIIFKKLLLE